MTIKIEWLDFKRQPKCAPNPLYPEGKDITLATEQPMCHTRLPYPAKGCGAYIVYCDQCKLRVALTTAGRPDDPRSITLPCKMRSH